MGANFSAKRYLDNQIGVPKASCSYLPVLFPIVPLMSTNYSREFMLRQVAERSTYSSSRATLTLDASVQTDDITSGAGCSHQEMTAQDVLGDQDLSELSASDMASILKWSSAFSSDINLSNGENSF